MWESASATVVTPVDNEPDNKADLYKTFNGGAKTSPAAGFRFDKTPVEAQYTACQSIFDQYGFVLETGGVAVADVDSTIAAYQAELDAAGYQDVLKEFQNQYNAWKG
jgi:putative aldouronate transport system substrate-binding protein